jgi:hypothetical protein
MFIDCVLPDGPTARGAATSWRVYLSWVFGCLGPPVGRDPELSNAKAVDDDLAETGIPVTKWPLAAQAACPAGHTIFTRGDSRGAS